MNAPAPAPLVTVITPTYNHASYIGRCLESVLAQTEPRWEQIVVDDGSTDGTAAIIGRFADPRIRHVSQRHRGIAGLGDVYNLALGMARGDYVAVLEGDDFWPRDKLERQLPAFEDPEVVLSWGLATETDPTGEARRVHPARDELRRHQHQDRRADRRGAAREERHSGMHGGVPDDRPACRWRVPPACRASRMSTIRPGCQLCRVGRFAPIDGIMGYYRRHERQVSATMTSEMQRNWDVGPAFVEGLDARERETLGVSG